MLMFRIDWRIITCTCKLYSFYGKAKEFIACTIHNVNFNNFQFNAWVAVCKCCSRKKGLLKLCNQVIDNDF